MLERTVYGPHHLCWSAGESYIPIPISSHCCLNISFLLLHLLLFSILISRGIERTEFLSHTYMLINNPLTAKNSIELLLLFFHKTDHTTYVFQYRKPPVVQYIATGHFLLHQRHSEIYRHSNKYPDQGRIKLFGAPRQ